MQQRLITLLRLCQKNLLESPTHRPRRLSLLSVPFVFKRNSKAKDFYPLHCIRRSLIILTSTELNYVGRGSHCSAMEFPFFRRGDETFDKAYASSQYSSYITFCIRCFCLENSMGCFAQNIGFLEISINPLK